MLNTPFFHNVGESFRFQVEYRCVVEHDSSPVLITVEFAAEAVILFYKDHVYGIILYKSFPPVAGLCYSGLPEKERIIEGRGSAIYEYLYIVIYKVTTVHILIVYIAFNIQGFNEPYRAFGELALLHAESVVLVVTD